MGRQGEPANGFHERRKRNAVAGTIVALCAGVAGGWVAIEGGSTTMVIILFCAALIGAGMIDPSLVVNWLKGRGAP